MRTHSTIIRLLVAAPLVAGVLAVSACGGDDNAGAGSDDPQAESRDAALKFAECMRENGVDMPDPGTDGRQTFRVGPGTGTTPEEMEEAQKACEKYQQQIEPPELSEGQQEEFKKAALEHARCMRDHGIENFPDPTFGENGGARIRIGPGSGIDPESSEFKEAQEACQDKRPQGPSSTSVGGEQ
jgi:hypothetical protein